LAALGTDTWQDKYGLSLKVFFFFEMGEDYDGTWGGPAVAVLSEVHIRTHGSDLAASEVLDVKSELLDAVVSLNP